jgi:hypothetical protein
VKLGRKLPAVGDVSQPSEETTFELTAGPLETKGVDVVEKREEVLVLEGHAASKMKVTFEKKHKVQTRAGTSKTMPSALEGKTYILTRAGGATTFTDDKGAPISAAEEVELQKAYRHFGEPDPIVEKMPEEAIVGDEIPELAMAIEQRIGGGDMRCHDAKVSLKKTEDGGATAVFALSFTLSPERKTPMQGEISLAGTLAVRAKDGRMDRVEMDGPIEMKRDGKVVARGRVTMRIRERAP